MIITTANCYVKKQSYSDYAPLLPRMRWFATKTVYIVTVKNIDMCKGMMTCDNFASRRAKSPKSFNLETFYNNFLIAVVTS